MNGRYERAGTEYGLRLLIEFLLPTTKPSLVFRDTDLSGCFWKFERTYVAKILFVTGGGIKSSKNGKIRALEFVRVQNHVKLYRPVELDNGIAAPSFPVAVLHHLTP